MKRGTPGRRFQQRYERTHRAQPRRGFARRVATIAVALLVLVLGLFFAVFPGPAIPFFIVAAALLATQSRAIARGLDALEVRVRRGIAWGAAHWRRLPVGARVVVAIAVLGCPVMCGYLTYRFVRGA